MREVFAHARDGWPEEVCGLLIGARDADAVDSVRRCANVQNQLNAVDPAANPRDARTAYSLDAADTFLLARSQQSDRPVRVVYHSHVDTGAELSAEDRRAALAGGTTPAYPVFHLVVDVRHDGVRGAQLFGWSGTEFVRVASYVAASSPSSC